MCMAYRSCCLPGESRAIWTVYHMFLGFDLYSTDPARHKPGAWYHIIPTDTDLDYLDDLYDLWDLYDDIYILSR